MELEAELYKSEDKQLLNSIWENKRRPTKRFKEEVKWFEQKLKTADSLSCESPLLINLELLFGFAKTQRHKQGFTLRNF